MKSKWLTCASPNPIMEISCLMANSASGKGKKKGRIWEELGGKLGNIKTGCRIL